MKHILPLWLVFLLALPCQAGVLEDMWDKYAPPADKTSSPSASTAPASKATATPGRVLGQSSEARNAVFAFAWRYRETTYELHYEVPQALARSIYGLALHTRDVDESLAVERFIGGVLGFHYSVSQVCDWLNDVTRGKFAAPTLDENMLVGMLLQDGVLVMKEGRFVSAGKVHHILGAAPGKKRQFAANLLHERLHVFWDEDAAFKKQALAEWNALSDEERQSAKKSLARYASGNEKQLIEEWAIGKAESSSMTLE